MRVDVGERLDGAPDEGKDGRPVKALPDSWAGGGRLRLPLWGMIMPRKVSVPVGRALTLVTAD